MDLTTFFSIGGLPALKKREARLFSQNHPMRGSRSELANASLVQTLEGIKEIETMLLWGQCRQMCWLMRDLKA